MQGEVAYEKAESKTQRPDGDDMKSQRSDEWRASIMESGVLSGVLSDKCYRKREGLKRVITTRHSGERCGWAC